MLEFGEGVGVVVCQSPIMLRPCLCMNIDREKAMLGERAVTKVGDIFIDSLEMGLRSGYYFEHCKMIFIKSI
jgi:hypothetical protein